MTLFPLASFASLMTARDIETRHVRLPGSRDSAEIPMTGNGRTVTLSEVGSSWNAGGLLEPCDAEDPARRGALRGIIGCLGGLR